MEPLDQDRGKSIEWIVWWSEWTSMGAEEHSQCVHVFTKKDNSADLNGSDGFAFSCSFVIDFMPYHMTHCQIQSLIHDWISFLSFWNNRKWLCWVAVTIMSICSSRRPSATPSTRYPNKKRQGIVRICRTLCQILLFERRYCRQSEDGRRIRMCRFLLILCRFQMFKFDWGNESSRFGRLTYPLPVFQIWKRIVVYFVDIRVCINSEDS